MEIARLSRHQLAPGRPCSEKFVILHLNFNSRRRHGHTATLACTLIPCAAAVPVHYPREVNDPITAGGVAASADARCRRPPSGCRQSQWPATRRCGAGRGAASSPAAVPRRWLAVCRSYLRARQPRRTHPPHASLATPETTLPTPGSPAAPPSRRSAQDELRPGCWSAGVPKICSPLTSPAHLRPTCAVRHPTGARPYNNYYNIELTMYQPASRYSPKRAPSEAVVAVGASRGRCRPPTGASTPSRASGPRPSPGCCCTHCRLGGEAGHGPGVHGVAQA